MKTIDTIAPSKPLQPSSNLRRPPCADARAVFHHPLLEESPSSRPSAPVPLALAGVAPLSLWATKDAVLTATLESSPWLYAVGLVAGALSAAYSGKILWTIWRRSARESVDSNATGTVSTPEQVPLFVLAVGAALLGALALSHMVVRELELLWLWKPSWAVSVPSSERPCNRHSHEMCANAYVRYLQGCSNYVDSLPVCRVASVN